MKTNTIIVAVVTLLLAAVAYVYFFTGTGDDSSLFVAPAASDAQIQFETLASELPTSFNTAIFSDARFNALVDMTQSIQQEPAGRLDPLAPIPGVIGTN